MILNIVFIIIGFALLIKGADVLVDGASEIAKKFHISEIIIGLTIVSIGTSFPELMISLTSALENKSDMAIGNVIGSNISNLFLILGICSIIKPLTFKDKTIKIEIPFVIFLTALLYILANNGVEKVITRNEGLILITFFALFIIYNIIIAKRNSEKYLIEEEKEEEKRKSSIFGSIIKIIIGVIALKFGGDFVVDSASEIAESLGVSEKMISLTIVSFSTSLPELITSITATLKGKVDMGIGNIIGSNILNIVLIVGVTAFIRPIEYSISYNEDLILFMIGMIILLIIPFIGEKNKISKWGGFLYFFTYVFYMVSLVRVNLL